MMIQNNPRSCLRPGVSVLLTAAIFPLITGNLAADAAEWNTHISRSSISEIPKPFELAQDTGNSGADTSSPEGTEPTETPAQPQPSPVLPTDQGPELLETQPQPSPVLPTDQLQPQLPPEAEPQPSPVLPTDQLGPELPPETQPQPSPVLPTDQPQPQLPPEPEPEPQPEPQLSPQPQPELESQPEPQFEPEPEPQFEPEPEPQFQLPLEPEPEPQSNPAPLPSLKSVRQSVNIPLPSEAERATLPELSFDIVQPGVAGQGDAEIDGRRVDFYQFQGTENQQIVVVLRNSNDSRSGGLRLTPYMMVFDPNGQVLAATIVPEQYRIPTTDPLLPRDNQLALRLPQSGRYIVAVFTDPGQVGRYGVGWKQDNARYLYDQTHELTTTSPSETATSEAVEITGQAGQTLHVEATSYQFDPYLTLVDANGNVIARDDDNGGNYNARIDITLPANGTYRAIVTSANGRGQYRLRVH